MLYMEEWLGSLSSLFSLISVACLVKPTFVKQVIVFDECHKAKNCTVTVNEKSGFAQSESKTARVRARAQLFIPHST